MKERTIIFSLLYPCAQMILMFAIISDLKVALWVNASIAGGTLLWFLRHRWAEDIRNRRLQEREKHKQRLNIRPASQHLDDIKG